MHSNMLDSDLFQIFLPVNVKPVLFLPVTVKLVHDSHHTHVESLPENLVKLIASLDDHFVVLGVFNTDFGVDLILGDFFLFGSVS